MPGLLATIAIQLVISLIITAIASRLMKPDGIKKKGLDDFTFPTVSQDRAIPVVFGDVLVEGPNITWFGDYKSKRIKEGGGLFSPSVTVGHSYFIGMEISLCWGTIDHLTEVRFGENTAWLGDETDNEADFSVHAPNLFGGSKSGGGVRATCTLYTGTSTQNPDPYMSSQLSKGYAHRGITKVIWNGPNSDKGSGYIGEGNVVPPIKVRIEKYPNYLGTIYKSILGSGAGEGAKGANPAEVVYSLLVGRYINVDSTNPTVPTIPESLINNASFIAAAEVLAGEGMGVSFQWQRDTVVKDIIDDVLFHIDGELIEDNSTGEIHLILYRNDYDEETLPVFDESNIADVISFNRVGPSAAANRVTASYTSSDHNFQSIPVTVEDLGNIYEQDSGSPVSLDFHMFQDVTAVVLRATRELVQLSEGMASGKIKVNRSAHNLNIGDPIKFTWGPLGVSELIVRVTEKTVGALDDRHIELSFAQDIFGIGTAIYGVPGSTSWVDIHNDPADISDYKFLEMPYYLESYEGFDPNYFLFLLTKFPTSDTAGYEPFLSLPDSVVDYHSYAMGSGLPENDFTTLVDDYNRSAGPGKDVTLGVRVVGEPPPDMVSTVTFTEIKEDFRNWVLIGDEMLAYESVTDIGDGSWRLNNVYRGMADTIPETHVSGSTVWYLGDEFLRLNHVFTKDVEIDIKTVTTTAGSTLDIASASAKNFTPIGRKDKPYPPVNIQMNSEYYPAYVLGDILFEWSNRDRTDLTDIYLWDAADETPEAGQTVTLKIYDSVSTLIRTETGLAGTSYSYTEATELADAGSLQTQLTVEMFSVRAGEDSYFTFSYTFSRQPADPDNLIGDSYMPQVVSLLNFEGMPDGTTVTDFIAGNTWTVSGSIDVASGELDADGTASWLQHTDVLAFRQEFDGTNSDYWTYEAKIRINTTANNETLLDWRPDFTNRGMLIGQPDSPNSNKMKLSIGDDTAGWDAELSSTDTFAATDEVEVAVTRYEDDYRLHLDGVYQGKVTLAGGIELGSGGLRMAAARDGTTTYAAGWEMMRQRLTSGISRYGEGVDYTPEEGNSFYEFSQRLYALWDALTVVAAEVTNGGLTVESDGGGLNARVESTIPKTDTDDFAVEFTIDYVGDIPDRCYVGFRSGTSPAPGNLDRIWWRGNGQYQIQGDNSSAGAWSTYTTGDVISMRFKNGDLWVGKNGVWEGGGDPELETLPSYSGITGSEIRANFNSDNAGTPGDITINSGLEGFQYFSSAIDGMFTQDEDADFADNVLLLHFDNGDIQDITELAIPTLEGSASMDSDIGLVTGTKGVLFLPSGNSTRMSIPYGAYLKSGANDFTAELKFRVTSTFNTSAADVFAHRDDISEYGAWVIRQQNDDLLVSLSEDGLAWTSHGVQTFSDVLTLGQIHTVALSRVGTDVFFFLDGALLYTFTSVGTLASDNRGLSIGGGGGGTDASIRGEIDEVRYTIDTGRYSATYTPTLNPFPNG